MADIEHRTKGLARPCSAWDIFAVTGGLQCGNCLAHNVPPGPPGCTHYSTVGPCPLPREDNEDTCWIHRIAPCPNPPEDPQ